jgi:hypothetical protein
MHTSIRSSRFLLFFAAFFLAASARAESVSLGVGQTKVIGLRRVAHVTVSDRSIVEVKVLKNGGGVSLVGKEAGRVNVQVSTKDGDEVQLVLYVTAGAGAYLVNPDRAGGGGEKLQVRRPVEPRTKRWPVAKVLTESGRTAGSVQPENDRGSVRLSRQLGVMGT